MSLLIKRIALLTIVVSVYGVLFFAPAAATLQGLQVGMEGPDFSLKTVDGDPRTFADLKGEKLTILVFWSTWSSKSEKVLARMQKLHEQYKGRGLSIVGINADEQHISDKSLTEIKAERDKLKITFPLLLDQGLTVFHEYGVIALPSFVVLDKDRLVKYELSGYPLVGAEELVDFVVSTIEGKKAPVVREKTGYLPNKEATRFFNMGKTTLKSKRMADTAEMWFKKAIEADPKFILPYLSLGKMYLERGDAASAQGLFKEVIVREPGNPIALCESGMILVNEGKNEAGIAQFESAKRKEDSYAPCYYYAGYAYGKAGKMEEALKMFDEAEKINPFDYLIYVYKGKVFEEQKNQRLAFEAYKKGLELILHIN